MSASTSSSSAPEGRRCDWDWCTQILYSYEEWDHHFLVQHLAKHEPERRGDVAAAIAADQGRSGGTGIHLPSPPTLSNILASDSDRGTHGQRVLSQSQAATQYSNGGASSQSWSAGPPYPLNQLALVRPPPDPTPSSSGPQAPAPSAPPRYLDSSFAPTPEPRPARSTADLPSSSIPDGPGPAGRPYDLDSPSPGRVVPSQLLASLFKGPVHPPADLLPSSVPEVPDPVDRTHDPGARSPRRRWPSVLPPSFFSHPTRNIPEAPASADRPQDHNSPSPGQGSPSQVPPSFFSRPTRAPADLPSSEVPDDPRFEDRSQDRQSPSPGRLSPSQLPASYFALPASAPADLLSSDFPEVPGAADRPQDRYSPSPGGLSPSQLPASYFALPTSASADLLSSGFPEVPGAADRSQDRNSPSPGGLSPSQLPASFFSRPTFASHIAQSSPLASREPSALPETPPMEDLLRGGAAPRRTASPGPLFAGGALFPAASPAASDSEADIERSLTQPGRGWEDDSDEEPPLQNAQQVPDPYTQDAIRSSVSPPSMHLRRQTPPRPHHTAPAPAPADGFAGWMSPLPSQPAAAYPSRSGRLRVADLNAASERANAWALRARLVQDGGKGKGRAVPTARANGDAAGTDGLHDSDSAPESIEDPDSRPASPASSPFRGARLDLDLDMASPPSEEAGLWESEAIAALDAHGWVTPEPPAALHTQAARRGARGAQSDGSLTQSQVSTAVEAH